MPATRPQAVFFDLDDTLFDCHGQLVLPAHREAVAAMIEAGLPADPEEALRRRLDIFARRPREDVNRLLAESYGVRSPEVVDVGYRAYHRRDVGPIHPYPGATTVLERLREAHPLFLVTAGDPETQARKVERLDLEKHFDRVVTVDPSRGETKEEAFRTLLRDGGLRPADCIVVGNRVDSEIRAGIALGTRTVWLRKGEYAHLEPAGPDETPDRTIESLADLPSAIDSIAAG